MAREYAVPVRSNAATQVSLRARSACLVYVGFNITVTAPSNSVMSQPAPAMLMLKLLKTYVSHRCRELRTQTLLPYCNMSLARTQKHEEGDELCRNHQSHHHKTKWTYHFLIYIQAAAINYWCPTPGTASPSQGCLVRPSCLHVNQFPYAFLKRSTASKMSSLQHSKHGLNTWQ